MIEPAMKSTHSQEYTQLVTALIAARKERRVLQVDLARKLGKPQSFISKYEGRERRLDLLEFIEVCRALEANPISLMRHAGLITDDEIRDYPS